VKHFGLDKTKVLNVEAQLILEPVAAQDAASIVESADPESSYPPHPIRFIKTTLTLSSLFTVNVTGPGV
jgi:hypothetical protein